MIRLEDHQVLTRDIAIAHSTGARLKSACEIAGIDQRSIQRLKTFSSNGLTSGDRRPHAVRSAPSHALSEPECAHLLTVANEPRFAAVPSARIVPMLADEGVYLASKSTFSHVLKAHGQSAHRERAKARKTIRPPTTHIATEP